ncbi:MAG: hypothetical protein B0D92_00930, partial [Spirochaeta sp. LUC14_002_19_P3]
MSINKFIRLILKHSKLIIATTIAITVFLGWKALGIGINTDVNTLMPSENERINKIKTDLGVDKEVLNYMYLSIYGSDIYNLETLGLYQDTIDKVLALPEIETVISPFNFIFFQSDAKRIIPTTISPTGRAPLTEEELEIFSKRVKDNTLSKNFVVGDNGRILTAVFIGTAVNSADNFIAAFNAAIGPLKKATNVHYSGEVAFQERVAFYLLKDFSNLLKLAVFAMLAIFGLSFRSLRAIILPILVVVMGAVWTLGVMAIIGFKITVLTVVIPSMVLAIGSSYTIHILNEYFRIGREAGMDKITWLTDAVEHVLKTVIVAALTTVISFMSLLTTTLQPLREFGLAISLGIFFCAVLALFFLPAVFCILKAPSLHHKKRVSEGRLTRTVSHLGLWAHHSSGIVLGFFILLMALFLFCYPYIQHQSDYFSYFPANDSLITSSRFINEHSGGSQTLNLTLKAANGQKNFFLDPEILKKI